MSCSSRRGDQKTPDRELRIAPALVDEEGGHDVLVGPGVAGSQRSGEVGEEGMAIDGPVGGGHRRST